MPRPPTREDAAKQVDGALVSQGIGVRDRHEHPFALPPDPLWQRSLSWIWLDNLARERAGLESAFLSLFAQAPLAAILRFIDGDASPRDVLGVVNALPPDPFLRALLPTPPG